jgi:hypothetical protein
VIRFVTPDTRTLTLEGGDTLTVKARLSHGEHVAMYARTYREKPDGSPGVNYLETGDALILAYLVEWHAADGRALPSLRALSDEERTDVIRNLDQRSFLEIKRAIEAHENRVAADDEALKKTDSIAGSSLSTWPSVA